MKHPNFEKEYGPDTVSIFRFFWPTLLVLAIFLLSFLAMTYLPEFNAWMDKVYRKSDQQRTGVIMLGIGSFSYIVLFLTGSLKR